MEFSQVKSGSPDIESIGGIRTVVLILPIHNMITDGTKQVIVHPNLIIANIDIESIGVCVDRMPWIAFGCTGDRTIGFAHIA